VGGVVIPASSQQQVDSIGVPIQLRAQQALRVRRYLSSLTYPTNDNVLFAQWGEMGYEVPPFGLGNGVIVYPTMTEISVPLAAQAGGAVTQGTKLFAMALDFNLLEDWIEYDDLPGHLESGSPVNNFTSLQLRTHWEVFNTSAIAKTVQVADMAIVDIYEVREL
jgi:hypothetical protein